MTAPRPDSTASEPPPEALVQTEGLTKRYGDFHALRDCSVEVAAGEVFGLLGPNGAGKTTLLRLLMGYLFPTSGRATIGGLDVTRNSVAVRRMVSYLPGDARLPRHMRARSVLEFFAQMQPDGDLTRSLDVANQLELELNRRVAFMSTGMRQKLALAVVLGARTPLLVLDEPTANLDPTVRSSILQMVAEAQSEGRTVIFSSHVLAEIEEVCSRVIFLRQGVLAKRQRMDELKQRHRIVAQLDAPLTSSLPDTLRSQVEISTFSPAAEPHTQWVRMDTAGDLAPLLGWLDSLQLKRMRVEPLGLRAIYDEVHDLERLSNPYAPPAEIGVTV
ncbi:ABC transporter ATP-binding protein [Roseimaritima ulvae]|uniref:ABC transporter ATP-binding protein YtrB n=1 Tax=Roseimaritima ulvae TaxID=980254 RepID=A0A5B9QR45_9BACT|nr:ABC transporter ATP-binding protein [Roseimaritima ulvae]QEG41577.1 ABC transporter ATP-binding protein YtrB [Roseimaritima ulvae]